MRRARSYAVMGRSAEARADLEEIVAHHKGASIAMEAQLTLDEIERGKEGNHLAGP